MNVAGPGRARRRIDEPACPHEHFCKFGHGVGWEGTGLLGAGDSTVRAAAASSALGGPAGKAGGIQVKSVGLRRGTRETREV